MVLKKFGLSALPLLVVQAKLVISLQFDDYYQYQMTKGLDRSMASGTKQILAMGGGGFSMEPENLKLDRYLLSLSGKVKPKVCFIGTASGDSESYIERFYNSMKELSCVPSHLALYRPPEEDLRDFVLDKDVFYVGGGNTRNLLVLWKEWSLDKYLKEAYDNGIVLGGISAGSICWFEQGLTDSVTGKLLPLDCLGFLRGSNCPHYDGE